MYPGIGVFLDLGASRLANNEYGSCHNIYCLTRSHMKSITERVYLGISV